MCLNFHFWVNYTQYIVAIHETYCWIYVLLYIVTQYIVTAKHNSWGTLKYYVKIQTITNFQQNSKFKDHLYLRLL